MIISSNKNFVLIVGTVIVSNSTIIDYYLTAFLAVL